MCALLRACGRAGGFGDNSAVNESQQEEMVQMIIDFPPLKKVMIRFHRVKYVNTQAGSLVFYCGRILPG